MGRGWGARYRSQQMLLRDHGSMLSAALARPQGFCRLRGHYAVRSWAQHTPCPISLLLWLLRGLAISGVGGIREPVRRAADPPRLRCRGARACRAPEWRSLRAWGWSRHAFKWATREAVRVAKKTEIMNDPPRRLKPQAKKIAVTLGTWLHNLHTHAPRTIGKPPKFSSSEGCHDKRRALTGALSNRQQRCTKTKHEQRFGL